MRISRLNKRRRATVLLMVVSLLALLFVIVTGYLSVSRTNFTITEEVSETNLAEDISESTFEWSTSLIKNQILNDGGFALSGGTVSSYSYEDIPGYRATNYLASLEPVWDKSWNTAFHATALFESDQAMQVLSKLRWPAVTSLDENVTTPTHFPIYELMRDYNANNTDSRLFLADVEWNARKPFMDADGDGIPDSHLLLCASATEAANSSTGRSVSLPRLGDANAFKPYALRVLNYSDGLWDDEQWDAYNTNARYETAVRIVSHGGMVTLDSPPLSDPLNNDQCYTPFNRAFTVNLFDQMLTDSRRMRYQYTHDMWGTGTAPHSYFEQDSLFDKINESSAAIEQSLRRRFMLPPAPAFYDYEQREGMQRMPAVLAELQGVSRDSNKAGFKSLFLPEFRPSGNDDYSQTSEIHWQRFNLGSDERWSWAHAVALDPNEYNLKAYNNQRFPLTTGYARRHLITTQNNSDELARKQTAGTPKIETANALYDPTKTLKDGEASLYDGELKYYLGEVSKAFEPWSLNSSVWKYNEDIGGVIIEQLARFYYDMLSSHSDAAGTTDDWANIKDFTTEDNEVVSRRQQALMLAVNTVAFAAPRSPGLAAGDADCGRIDTVWYYDSFEDLYYTGYTPQPFFTEAVAYIHSSITQTEPEDEQEEPNEQWGRGDEILEKATSIAVKIFNPHAPYYNAANVDEYALNLTDFRIRIVEDNHEPTSYSIVNTKDHLNGYQFYTLEIQAYESSADEPTPPTYLFSSNGNIDCPIDLGINGLDGNATSYTIHLIHYGVDNEESIIDTITIDKPADNEWNSIARDTSPSCFYNRVQRPSTSIYDYARWNVVTNINNAGVIDTGTGAPPIDVLDSFAPGARQQYTSSGNLYDPDPDPITPTPVPPTAFAPTIPLITMNAEPYNNLPMFGNYADMRPRSFPTTGFLLFLPRYTHVQDGELTSSLPTNAWPIGRILEEQWNDRDYNQTQPANPSKPLHPTEYPADFGHMPIFDNTQTIVGQSYLDETSKNAGLPWGLLVFDYFTTLDPEQDRNGDDIPDVDPLRVPGRININTAPWHVLANIPMMGPVNNSSISNSVLPILFDINNPDGAYDPSPEFWDPGLGVLAGLSSETIVMGWSFDGARLFAMYNGNTNINAPVDFPRPTWGTGQFRLGPLMAQSAASYRDGMQYVDGGSGLASDYYADAHLRNGTTGVYGSNGAASTPSLREYRPINLPGGSNQLYGFVRGYTTSSDSTLPDTPDDYGFISIGELLNVKGFDSTAPTDLGNSAHIDYIGGLSIVASDTTLARGDFVKAVSMLALIDSQYLTTRSNTFTIYTSVMDREEPERSIRTQTTVDRSNLLPELTYKHWDPTPSMFSGDQYKPITDVYAHLPRVPFILDLKDSDGNYVNAHSKDYILDTPDITRHDDETPQVISHKQIGYFNVEYDD